MPAPNPTPAATSGVLIAAQSKVRIKKIENPPAGKLNWLTTDSCTIKKRVKIVPVINDRLNNILNQLPEADGDVDGVGVTNIVTVGIGVGTGLTGANASRGSALGALTTTETTPNEPKFAKYLTVAF